MTVLWEIVCDDETTTLAMKTQNFTNLSLRKWTATILNPHRTRRSTNHASIIKTQITARTNVPPQEELGHMFNFVLVKRFLHQVWF